MPRSLFHRPKTLARSLTFTALTLGSLTGCGKDEAEYSVGDKLCEAKLNLVGTFTLGSPQPADIFGCWPVGTWNLAAQKETASDECAKTMQMPLAHDIKVTREGVEEGDTREIYEYLTVPGYERVRMKVTSGGSGLCEGGFQVFSQDGKESLNLKAFLYEGGRVDGFADFARYHEDSWVGPDTE